MNEKKCAHRNSILVKIMGHMNTFLKTSFCMFSVLATHDSRKIFNLGTSSIVKNVPLHQCVFRRKQSFNEYLKYHQLC